jgi:hypothetical protein
MSDFRAKDADRDRFVEIIEAAYVDGQLGSQDRDLRVTRALSAVTLAELEALTRDLQGRPAPVVVPQVPAPVRARRRMAGTLVGLGVLVAVLGVGVASVVLVAGADTDSATSSGVAPATDGPAPAQHSETVAEEQATPFAMTPGQVRRFLAAYEKEFGTLDAFEVGFYPDRVFAQVPVRGSRPRAERWTYDGAWHQDSEASRVIGPSVIIDVGELDVRRLFANIAVAKKVLRVQRGELTHVLVNSWTNDEPTVNIYLGNSFNESGYLKTTMSGVEVLRIPYDS